MKHRPVKYILPNGKEILLEYLYVKEIKKLLKIPTTVEQAKTILNRNKSLLKDILAKNDTVEYHGCPHCDYCDNCAWTLIYKKKEDTCFASCFDGEFSGFTLDHVDNVIEYFSDSEHCYAMDAEEAELTIAEAFIRGHIEWAEAIIALGGVAWPNGKMTEERQSECFG